MIRNILLIIAFPIALVACNQNNEQSEVKEGQLESLNSEESVEERLAYIKELEEKVWGSTATPTDVEAKKLLSAYSDFVNAYRNHEATPEFMFNAARLSSTLNKPRKAIELLTDLHDNFPGYKKRTEAAYLVAFIYDSQLNDREKARAAYEKVIELYPDSPWADDAHASINNLYKTDEELIKEFEAKNRDAN